MARSLKVFGTTLSIRSADKMDEHFPTMPGHQRRQARAVVAAPTKKAAADAFGLPMHEFNGFSSETGNDQEIATAMAKPGQVFARPIDTHHEPFVEITRTPHVPRKRVKSSFSFANIKPRPTFNQEELQTILERFEMANDPVGQSIAAKAREMLA